MRVVLTIKELRDLLREERARKRSIGFVATMGALHEGHLSLVKKSKSENDVTVMSIFVNPLQFGPKEDFQAYPRMLETDRELADGAGVDFLFTPTVKEMYPDDRSTFVEETSLSRGLCGPFRPGHFRGVCTVVLKLFEIVRPNKAYFGQKDAQQLRVVQKMVSDLFLDIDVIGCPIVREPDGLAMSSRNVYLSKEEREVAPAIYATLRKAQETFQGGERSNEKLVQLVSNAIQAAQKFTIQYVELRRWNDLGTISTVNEPSLLAVAAYLGKTRLIDNILLTP